MFIFCAKFQPSIFSSNLRLCEDGAVSEGPVRLDLGEERRLDPLLPVPHLRHLHCLALGLLRRKLLKELGGLLDTPGLMVHCIASSRPLIHKRRKKS